MPRRAVRLLDNRIEPKTKSTASGNKPYLAVFLLFLAGHQAPKEEKKTIEAPNLPAAIRTARQMCQNPSVFPPGIIARIPDRNVTPLPEQTRPRKYQAAFEIYRLGNRNSRPHISLMTIEAPGIREAEKIARGIARETPLRVKGAHASDKVICPTGNVKRIE